MGAHRNFFNQALLDRRFGDSAWMLPKMAMCEQGVKLTLFEWICHQSMETAGLMKPQHSHSFGIWEQAYSS